MLLSFDNLEITFFLFLHRPNICRDMRRALKDSLTWRTSTEGSDQIPRITTSSQNTTPEFQWEPMRTNHNPGRRGLTWCPAAFLDVKTVERFSMMRTSWPQNVPFIVYLHSLIRYVIINVHRCRVKLDTHIGVIVAAVLEPFSSSFLSFSSSYDKNITEDTRTSCLYILRYVTCITW